MKKILYSLTSIFLILFASLSCQREVDGNVPVIVLPATVQANILGRVVDEKKLPVSGASVSTEFGNTMTDVNGDFKLNQVAIKRDAGFIKIEKTGYFTGSKTLVVTAGADNYMEVELIPKTAAGNFGAAAGGAIQIPSGGSINFPANAIINTTTNAAYTGTVSVAAHHLNPSASNFAAIMPGALRGINTGNTEVALQSFGMMAIELAGANGEKLQLATGKTASINFPITAALQASAPQTIPLWYFNETTGLWKEEGMATKQGASYVGTVSHFSFWNCDAPFPLIDFEAVIHDQNGNPVKAKVEITMSANKTSVTSSGFSDAEGKIGGKIPGNETLFLEVFNSCNQSIYSKTIGPFSSKTALGVIKTNYAQFNSLITGTAVDCNNTALSNGLVNVFYNGKNFRANVVNGNFSVQVTSCTAGSAPASINAFDIANNKMSDTVTLSVTSGSNATAGKLTACQANTSSNLTLTLGTQIRSFTAPVDSFTVYRKTTGISVFFITSSDGRESLNFSFNGAAAPGTYPLNELYYKNADTAYNMSGLPTVSITEYGAVNGFIAGSFSGNVRKQDSTMHPMSFTFRVQRQQ